MSAGNDDDLDRKLAQTAPGDELTFELRRIKEEAAKGAVSRRSLRGLIEENGREIRAARDAGASWDLIRAPIEKTLGRPVSQRTLETYMADLVPRKGARLTRNSKPVADVDAGVAPLRRVPATRTIDERLLAQSRSGLLADGKRMPADSTMKLETVVKTQAVAPADSDTRVAEGSTPPHNPFQGRR